MPHQDSSFIKTFSTVVAGLVVFSIFLAVFAGLFQQQLTQEVSEARLEAVEERIAPIGAVHAGESGEQALAASTVSSGAAPSTDATSTDATAMSGEQVYNNVCGVCHESGAGGAPQLEPPAWQERIDKGRETLVSHAINGFQGNSGMMPAKGGRMDLSDEQVRKAVDYMLAQVEGG